MSIQKNCEIPGDAGKNRKDIRNRLYEILRGNTLAGDKVFPNISTAYQETDLPGIFIYPRSESASLLSTAPREYRRTVDMSIEIVAQGPEVDEDGDLANLSLEDLLDDIAAQVEALIEADDTLGDYCDEAIYTNTEMDFVGEGGKPTGSARLTYSITYYTHAIRNPAELPDFETAGIEYDVNETELAQKPTDSVAIPLD